MYSVSKILNVLLKDVHINQGKSLQSLRINWEVIIGDAIARHTYPAYLKGQAVDIIVDSNAWLQNLTFMKSMILEKLQDYKINEIRFRIGKIPEPERIKNDEALKKRKLNEEERLFIQNSVLPIEDKELRECFEKLMTTAMEAVRPEK